MNRTKTSFGANGEQGRTASARQYVASDCVVFEGRCFCELIQQNAEKMLAEAVAANKKKIVIFGDCEDHYEETEKTLGAVMEAAGIEWVWFPEEVHDGYTDAAIPGFSETRIHNFAEAAQYAAMRKLADKMGKRVDDINSKIAEEKDLLAKYPTAAKIVSIESEDYSRFQKEPSAFEVLFGGQRPYRIVSKTPAIVLFNIEAQTGVLVTKAMNIKFTVPPAYNTVPGVALDILRGERKGREKGYTTGHGGSVRVKIGKDIVKLYCAPGAWTVGSHPELDTTDLNVSYVPMWERVFRD